MVNKLILNILGQCKANISKLTTGHFYEHNKIRFAVEHPAGCWVC